MTTITYGHCYRVLGIRDDCEWHELRLAYRRRVRLCHPDRAAPGHGGKHDDEFKQVVRAYRLLSRFHRQHGEFPPPWLAADDNAAAMPMPAARTRPSAGSTGWDTADDGPRRTVPRFHWRPRPFHLAVFAAFVSGVCTAAIFDRLDGGERIRRAATGNQPLAVGMNPQSVVDIQGVPTHTKGSIWFYGESGVIFDQGCVVGWENQPPFPLRTRIPVHFTGRPAQPARETNFPDCTRRMN